MNLRKYAEGQPCYVRIPNICSHDPSTVVLAHIRRGGTAGVGQKPADLIGVWACHSCHDVLDRRNSMGAYTPSEIDGYVLDALCRQLDYYVREEIVTW